MVTLPILNKILVIVIDIIGVWLGFLVYRNNPKGKLNRIFICMVLTMFAWVNFAYFARLAGSDQLALSSLYLRIAWFVTPLLFTLLYFLVVHLIKKANDHPFLNNLILLLGVGSAFVTAFTDLIIKGIEFINGDLTIIYGLGMLPFLTIIAFIMAVTLYFVIRAYSQFSAQAKLKLEYFLLGILIFYLANLVFNIFFPTILGVARFYWLGDYSAIFLLGFIAYAIVKRQLFGIRLVLTSLFVGLIAVLLAVDAVAFTSQISLQILKGITLGIFLYFGWLLINSVLQEVNRREEMEQLTAEVQRSHIKLADAFRKLKKLDKAKSEFISIASHQLRTPLTAIKGYISMIIEGTYGKLPAKSTRPMARVYYSNERLIKLVNDLLSVSRIEAGRIKVEKKEASLFDLIQSIINELGQLAKQKGIYLKMKEPAKPLPVVFIDSEKIRESVFNIVDNAIRYTKKGGITIEVSISSSKAKIKVTDTGTGMTPEEVAKVFDSFSRGKAGTNLWTGGAGLGLYVAKKFIEMHGGKIWASSKSKGKGSTFIIELPLT